MTRTKNQYNAIITNIVLKGDYMNKILKYIFACVLSISIIYTGLKAVAEVQNAEDNKIHFAVATADAWTPTFQLCWNELINLVGTSKIEYVDGNPKLADELNKKYFELEDLNPDSYYISVTKMTQKHKKEIEKAIWEKFEEKSDILDQFTFDNVSDNKTNKWFIYSMLLKNFKFFTPYEILDADKFSNSGSYKYFGFTKKHSNSEAKDVLENSYSDHLFYVNDDDFALKLKNKDKNEEMILYLTDSDESFDAIYNEILEKSKNKNEYLKLRAKEASDKYGAFVRIKFTNYYKIPFMHIDETLNYDKELADKDIKDKTYNATGYTWNIFKTLQTIKFDMDNEGAKLKSEAAIAVMKATAMRPETVINIDNNYFFDRPFVIFLKETGKDKPYFAARVKDGKYLVKE